MLQKAVVCEILVLRFEGALNFANFDYFRETLARKTSLDSLTLPKSHQESDTLNSKNGQKSSLSVTANGASGNKCTSIERIDLNSNLCQPHEDQSMECTISEIGLGSSDGCCKSSDKNLFLKHIILDCSSWSYIDYSATQLLQEVRILYFSILRMQ